MDTTINPPLTEPQEPFRQRMTDWIDDHLNPILVRDIRCWLRSKVFLIVFFIALILTQLVTIIFTMIVEQQSNVGREMFSIIMGGMGFFLIGIMPFLVQNRLSEELRNRSTELALISRMTPGILIRGKIFSGLAAILLYFSAVGPSLLIAYMLGGFSIGVGIYGVLMLLFLSAASMVLSLLFVTMHKHKPLRLLGIFSLGAGVFGGLMIGGVLEESARGRMFTDDDFWLANIVIVIISLAAMAFFYSVATARLSFDADNRDTRPRFALSVLCALTFLPILFIEGLQEWIQAILRSGSVGSWDLQITPALIFTLITFQIGSIFVMDTPEDVSLRIRASWPRWGIIRTLYYPGRGRLYAYILAHFAAFAVIACFCGLGESVFCRSYYGIPNTAFWETVSMLSILEVSLFQICGALFLENLLRRFFPKRSRTWNRGIVVLTIFVAWSLITGTFAIIVAILDVPKEFLLLNPWAALEYSFGRSSQITTRVPITMLVTGIPLAAILVHWAPFLLRTIGENQAIEDQHLSEITLPPQDATPQDNTEAPSPETLAPSAVDSILTDDASGQDDPDELLAEQTAP